jgi:hypothetical protein
MSDANNATPVAAPLVVSASVVESSATAGAGDVEKTKSAAQSFLDEDDDEAEAAGKTSTEIDDELEATFGGPEGAGAAGGDGDDAGDSEGSDDGEGSAEVRTGATLDDLDGFLGDEQESNAIVEVCKKKCLTCAALVPWAEKTYRSCHFSNGNENCPAQTIQIRTRIPLEDIVPRYMNAKDRNDSKFMMRFWQNLANKAVWQQEVIQEAIKQEEAKRSSR